MFNQSGKPACQFSGWRVSVIPKWGSFLMAIRYKRQSAYRTKRLQFSLQSFLLLSLCSLALRRPTASSTCISGRASFWGDAYTVRTWTRNLRTKFRKCVPTKMENWMARFKSTFTTITRFSEILKCCSQTMRAFRDRLPMCSLRRVETEFCFLRTLYASFPWFCV